MLPPTPLSTLFPYTTLFRSIGLASRKENPMQKWEYLVFESVGDASFTPKMYKINGNPKELINFYEDRKSTRLNSSHLVISYAVFCLKKKNKHQREPKK